VELTDALVSKFLKCACRLDCCVRLFGICHERKKGGEEEKHCYTDVVDGVKKGDCTACVGDLRGRGCLS